MEQIRKLTYVSPWEPLETYIIDSAKSIVMNVWAKWLPVVEFILNTVDSFIFVCINFRGLRKTSILMDI